MVFTQNWNNTTLISDVISLILHVVIYEVNSTPGGNLMPKANKPDCLSLNKQTIPKVDRQFDGQARLPRAWEPTTFGSGEQSPCFTINCYYKTYNKSNLFGQYFGQYFLTFFYIINKDY